MEVDPSVQQGRPRLPQLRAQLAPGREEIGTAHPPMKAFGIWCPAQGHQILKATLRAAVTTELVPLQMTLVNRGRTSI